MTIKLANNATSRLAVSISSSDTQFSVSPGEGSRFPSLSPGDWFPLTIVKSNGELEIVKCTARSGDIFTVERAQESTAANSFNVNDRVELRITEKTLDEKFTQPIAAAQQAADNAQQAADDAADASLKKASNLSDLTDKAAARSSLELGTAALESAQSLSTDYYGPTEPSTTFPGMTWADTGNGLIKRRNAADDAWVVEGELFAYKAKRNGDATQDFSAKNLLVGDGSPGFIATIKNGSVDAIKIAEDGETEIPKLKNVVSQDSGGNVLIGATTATAKLTVESTTGTGIAVTTSSSVGVSAKSTSSTGLLGESTSNYGVNGISSTNNGVLGISASGYGVYGITTSGTAGVYGTSTTRVGVHGASTSNYGVYGTSSTSVGGYFLCYGGNYGMYAQSSGNHGAFVRSLAAGYAGLYAADMTANYYALIGYTPTSGGSWAVYGAGNSYTSGTYSSSDARLKENIFDLEDSLSKIEALRPVRFDWKENSESRKAGHIHDTGLIAQEVLSVLPEIVTTLSSPQPIADPEGNAPEPTLNQLLGEYYVVDYVRLVPHLIKAIQEQQKAIQDLQDRVVALEGAK